MGKLKRHTEEFKREAVLAMESRGERSIVEVAKGLGVSVRSFMRGVKRTEQRPGHLGLVKRSSRKFCGCDAKTRVCERIVKY